jgi:DNA-damage-inducible protein J
MQNELLQVRVESKVKKQANRVLSSLGMDLSTGVRIFLNQVILKDGIPFDVFTENGFTKKQEEEMLREVGEVKRKYKTGKIKGYDNMEELEKDLLK